jgi:hypothetical protein
VATCMDSVFCGTHGPDRPRYNILLQSLAFETLTRSLSAHKRYVVLLGCMSRRRESASSLAEISLSDWLADLISAVRALAQGQSLDLLSRP